MNEGLRNKTPTRKSRVFIVEDHPVTRDGLCQILNFQSDLVVCGQAATTAEALKEIGRTKPDVVIVDITLANGNGLDLIKDLAATHPNLRTLVLSTHDEKIYAERALRAGARGYVMKQTPTAGVLKCIREVLTGQICVSDEMRSRMLALLNGRQTGPTAGVALLSDRELEVFRLLGHGHGTADIARQLCVSVSTVETYRAHIKEKLGLANAMDLVSTAVRWVQENG